jgi:hypothetical protein
MRLLLALLLAAAASAQHLEYSILNETVLQERLKLAHPKNAVRYQRLKALFEEAGCRGETYREQSVSGSKQPNMICATTAAGENPRKIVVGAHFDAVGGDGIVDNWSGAVLLPTLYQFMKRSPRRHTFEFVAFAGEEKGLLGSHTYVRSIAKKDRPQIAAVVTMDSLGLTPTKCWPHGSTKELVAAADYIARLMKLEFGGVNVDAVGTTDSAEFMSKQIPTLSLHSVTQGTWKLINGPSDVWSAVSWKDYYDSHKLISALLVYLDQTLP